MYIKGRMASVCDALHGGAVLMAVYRYQIVSVGMWRGKIKRWNTTMHYSTATATSSIALSFNKLCYPNPGDVVGACSGGLASITVYNASGGAPLSKTTYFDWQSPGSWVPFTGQAWSGTPEGTPIDASGESAFVLVGHMPGLSTTGKPITTRKYIHAVPSRTATNYADPDIDATTLAALVALFPASYLGNAAGVTPTSVTGEEYYFNHQRVRGRRRTTNQVAAGAFSAGVAAGAAAGSAGAASPQ